MHTTGLHHVAISVKELEPAVRFYADVMGFEQIERPDFGFPGAWFQAGDHQLHLMEMPDAEPDPRQHYALRVDDLDAAMAAITAAGGKVKRSLPDVPGAGRQAFLRDPTGNRIELNQPG
ncbi:MAG TPA: VOC family protein [Acidimicrobiales bacterium]|nr:VOC family protein [Acidimicrobiales bacterium]